MNGPGSHFDHHVGLGWYWQTSTFIGTAEEGAAWAMTKKAASNSDITGTVYTLLTLPNKLSIVSMEGGFMAKQVCPHCGYSWFPRVERPRRCPDCQKKLPKK